MRFKRLLLIAASAALLGSGGAWAGGAKISLDALDAVGDAALSQHYGRAMDVTSFSSDATQKNNQTVMDNATSVSAGICNCFNSTVTTMTFAGVQNQAINTAPGGAAAANINISLIVPGALTITNAIH